jgi:hypothetical protein
MRDDEDDVHVATLRRARDLNRRITAVVIAVALLAGATAFWVIWSELSVGGGVRGARAFGVGAATTIAGAFFGTLAVAWFVGRKMLVSRVRAWVDEAERANHVERGSLDYIVSMYAKERRPGDDDDVLRRR